MQDVSYQRTEKSLSDYFIASVQFTSNGEQDRTEQMIAGSACAFYVVGALKLTPKKKKQIEYLNLLVFLFI